MNIALHTNQLSLRGSEIAVFDYSTYLKTLLNHHCIILAKDPEIYPYSHPKAIKKFQDRFKVYFYKDFNEVDEILKEENIDFLYMIKSGRNDGQYSKKIETGIHCVFQDYENHGNRYAFISSWLASRFNNCKPVVPHMIDLPEENGDLREELNIPKNAIVLGRHGGEGTFDIKYVQDAVYDSVQKRNDLYFLFLNTNKFCPNHPRIIHLEGTEDMIYKTKFINTCDSMCYGRANGETFGLCIGEFSVCNKRIILPNHARDEAHIQILGDKGLYFSNYQELYKILISYEPDDTKDWNCYKEYNPSEVIKTFSKVFLE